jgi:hypothetical protein
LFLNYRQETFFLILEELEHPSGKFFDAALAREKEDGWFLSCDD